MHKVQRQVEEFHTRFAAYTASAPSVPTDEVRLLRFNLIDEEFEELSTAMLAKDLVGVADALGDLLYVIYGTALAYGLDMEPIVDEIHRSNMSKLWSDGTVRYREDGKILKPPTYSPAQLLREVTNQITVTADTSFTTDAGIKRAVEALKPLIATHIAREERQAADDADADQGVRP